MKKIIVFLLIILCFMMFSLDSKASNNEFFSVEKTKILGVNSNYQVKVLDDGFLLFNALELKYLYKNVEVYKEKDEYFSHAESQEALYIIVKSIDGFVLKKINKNNKKVQTEKIDFDNIGSMVIANNELVIVGSKMMDAVICKYSLELEYLHSYAYGGEDYETFGKVYVVDNLYYLIGIKDAHSLNSPFLDVGSDGEQKVFMTIIDSNGVIQDTCYFNHQEKLEDIGNTYFHAGLFIVEVLTLNESHVYILNKQLQCVDYITKELEDSRKIVISSVGKCLFVEGPNICVSTKEKMRDLKIIGEIVDVRMQDNILIVNYYQDHYLWEAKVYQYQIVNQEDIVINIFKGDFDPRDDMNQLKELQITSDIHKINITMEETIPSLNKQITGTYKGIFKIHINSQKVFEVTNPIIVEEYINIFDEHLYPLGYEIRFFGYGLMDDKSIVSGAKLNEVGKHTIVITDNLGNKKKYNIQVVEDYYNKEEEYITTDYVVNKNQPLEIVIDAKYLQDISAIIINDEEVDYQLIDDQITVALSHSNSGIYSYNINKILTSDKEVVIDKTFSVKVLKDIPVIKITEKDEENLVFDMFIQDPDKALKDIVFEVAEEKETLEIISSGLKNIELELGNISVTNNVQIKSYLVYDIGNGQLQKVDFLKLNIASEKELAQILKMEVSEDYQNINFEVYTNNSSLTLKEIVIKSDNIASKYQVTENYLPIYISISLSILIIVGITGYYFYKKHYKKKNY